MLRKRQTLEVQASNSVPDEHKDEINNLISPNKRRRNFVSNPQKQTSFSTDTSGAEASVRGAFKAAEAPPLKKFIIDSFRIEEEDEAKENSPDSGLLPKDQSDSEDEVELVIANRPVADGYLINDEREESK